MSLGELTVDHQDRDKIENESRLAEGNICGLPCDDIVLDNPEEGDGVL